MVFSLLINHCLHGFAKMNQLMSLLTLVFFLQLQISVSIDPHYDTCSSRKCGDLEITYPFRLINKQRSYCGYPGFEVSCLDGKTPYINISGDSYVIQNIWYENQSFQVINSHIMASIMGNDCSSSIKNLTLDNSVFGFANNHDDIILFRNCSDEILKENKQDGLECRGVAMYGNDPKLKDLVGKCGGVNSVPYDGERVSNFTKVLSSGVWLNWTANNCSDCTDTGGQCGFDRNTSLFRCFCSDRPHSHQCMMDPTHPIAEKEKKNTPLTIGLSAAGGGIVLTLLLSIAFWYRRKLKLGNSKYVSRSDSLDRTTSDLEKGSIYFGVPVFSYSELQEATDNFNRSRELGDGGFGTVYFGKLKDGREVAVKRLFEKSYKRVEQFMNEVQILTCLRHNNLVSLYGCTSHHCRELLLLYEYVPNGTVADHLYGDRAKSGSLPWQVRIRIAIETASALSYLHASDIIHRDVKTSNILLDSSFSVKVADFGLSRLFPNNVTHVSTAPQGTPGYLDPEYHQCYQLTDKSDVYSFGVLLIELISSLPAVDMNRHRQEINLSNYAMNRIQRCAFDELVDPQLGFMSDFKIRRMTTAVAELAFQCLQHDKEFRPSMDKVLEDLRRIESADYEALKADEVSKNDGMGKSTMPPPSPTEDDDAKILSNRQPQPFSPSSVIDKWVSRSTTPSTSK